MDVKNERDRQRGCGLFVLWVPPSPLSAGLVLRLVVAVLLPASRSGGETYCGVLHIQKSPFAPLMALFLCVCNCALSFRACLHHLLSRASLVTSFWGAGGRTRGGSEFRGRHRTEPPKQKGQTPLLNHKPLGVKRNVSTE